MLQFGRIGTDRFTLDFGCECCLGKVLLSFSSTRKSSPHVPHLFSFFPDPFSPMQAFGAVIASMDTKIADSNSYKTFVQGIEQFSEGVEQARRSITGFIGGGGGGGGSWR